MNKPLHKVGNKDEQKLLTTFKNIIKQGSFRSQDELALALSKHGYENISQSKVSRMLAKLGAVKSRNIHNEVVYTVPDALIVPKNKACYRNHRAWA